MSNIGGSVNMCTAYEIQAIETYLAAPERLISLSTASNRLKLFKPEEVDNFNSPKAFFNVSNQTDLVYQHYKARYPNKIEKQKLNNYEELKHRAISYCEECFNYYNKN